MRLELVRRSAAKVASLIKEAAPKTKLISEFPALREVLASQERVSGFPETGADLRGSPGNFRGSPGNFRGGLGNFWGTSGKLPGNPWIAVKFHSERTSGEVAEKLPGKFGRLPGKSGDFPEARGSPTPSQRLAKFVSNQQDTKEWVGLFYMGNKNR